MTKYLIFIFLAFGVTTTIVKAQFGIKGGLGIADIGFRTGGQIPYLSYEVDYLEHNLPTLSYHLGAYGKLHFDNRWSLQPEILFSTGGLNYRQDFLYDEVTYRLDIGYLQLPMLVSYQFAKEKRKEKSLFLGLYFAKKLYATKTTVLRGNKNRNKVDNVKPSDIGALVGCSFQISPLMHLELRVNYSLANMMEVLPNHVPEFQTHNSPYVRNINTVLSLTYQLIEDFPEKMLKNE